MIAKGVTEPVHGICLETKEWKRNLGIKYKGSHVDWWLYTDAEPYREFEVFENENRKEYLEKYQNFSKSYFRYNSFRK